MPSNIKSTDFEDEPEGSGIKFNNLADVLPQKVWTAKADGFVDYFNKSWYEYTKLPFEELKGEGWIKVIHSAEIGKILIDWKKSLESGNDFQIEHRLLKHDGSYRWHLTKAICQKDEIDSFCRWIGTSSDIQEQKSFSEELEKEVLARTAELNDSQSFLDSILNTTKNIISCYEAVYDNDGQIIDFKIIYNNVQLTKVTGLQTPDIIGKTLREIYPMLFTNGVFERLVKCVITGEPDNYETSYVYNNEEIWFSGSIVKLNNGVTITSKNITEEKKSKILLDEMNQKLVQQNEILERTNTELASFSYIASHDLQEPLRKILSFTTRILAKDRESFSDQTKDYFSRITSAASRMQNLIDDLLNYSRISITDTELKVTDLNHILQQAKDYLSDIIEETNATIEAQSLPALPVVPFQIQQLFQNLIGNAVKYSKKEVTPAINVTCETIDGKEIDSIEAKPKWKYYQISIIDNGIGFEQEHANKIFELFQRLHGKSEYNGTGIGLAICKKIVQNHNGIITAKGQLNIGSVFNIYFPVEKLTD